MGQWKEIKQEWNYTQGGNPRPLKEKIMMAVNALWFVPVFIIIILYVNCVEPLYAKITKKVSR